MRGNYVLHIDCVKLKACMIKEESIWEILCSTDHINQSSLAFWKHYVNLLLQNFQSISSDLH